MRTLIVCVSYKTEKESVRFIQSLYETEQSGSLDIILVNNSASSIVDKSFSSLTEKYTSLKVVNYPDNVGYFGAAKMVLSTVDTSLYDWIVVSNVDVVVEDALFFEKLKKYLSKENIAVVAPSVISLLSKTDTNPFMVARPDKSRMQFYKTIFSNYLSCQFYHVASLLFAVGKKPFLKAAAVINEEQSIYAAHGSFFIFSKRFFKKGGNLNFGTYMYGEEIFIAEQCLRLNLEILYVPNLEVIHTERASTGLFYSKKTLSWKKHSSAYLVKEFFSHE